MTLYPLGIHTNLSPLGLNPGFLLAPRVALRCLPCLAVSGILPTADTTDTLPPVAIALLWPPITLAQTIAQLDACPHCDSQRLDKDGFDRTLASGKIRQRWRCKKCGKKLVENSVSAPITLCQKPIHPN